MPNLVKRRMAGELDRLVAGPSSFIFLGTQGLTVQQATNLRAALGEWNLRLRVVRNTLAGRALRDRGLAAAAFLRGPTAIVPTDEAGALAAARVLVEAKKRYPKVELRGGFLEGRRIAAGDLAGLASIPPREVLLAQTLGSILGPATAVASLFVSTLSVPARLAAALEPKRETSEREREASEREASERAKADQEKTDREKESAGAPAS
ncbi:MAG: 50S ribosomal protein L10 [Planctomycetota bacterium]